MTLSARSRLESKMAELLLLLVALIFAPCGIGQTREAAELRIQGAVAESLSLHAADLKKMPRTVLTVDNPHEKRMEKYEGVLLEELLRRAGAPHGDQLRGTALNAYVVAEGADGYKVVFSMAELDSGIVDSRILVADTVDGAALGPKIGPFRLVAPHEKRPARWVRMLQTVTVVSGEAAKLSK